MNDVPSPSTRRRLLVVATLAAFTGAIGLAAWWHYQPRGRPTFAGEAITVAGRYRSPNGTTILTLEQSSDGQTLNVRVSKHEGSPDHSGGNWEIDSDKRWLFTFDENDKLWGYSGDRGPHSWQTTTEGTGFTIIGIGGGWAGAPESFIKSLPEGHHRTYMRWLKQHNDAQG